VLPLLLCWHLLQGALLLLLFRCSHQLEHRLTDKAAGGLQRLFDSVPDRAVVVEVEQGSNAPKVATSQEVRAGKTELLSMTLWTCMCVARMCVARMCGDNGSDYSA
jgi:hypothetical protein